MTSGSSAPSAPRAEKHFLVVGAGFSGAVLARELAERGGHRVTILEQRPHIAGNCHTERDPETGVMVHQYGPHIFNTDNTRVWEYINRFGRFIPWVNRVKATNARGVFTLPINLHTINQFFGLKLNPAEARAFLASKADRSIKEPRNFEEQALHLIGRELYEAFFRDYTRKQWGCDPAELPASVLKRLPVRFDYNDNYYDKALQGIPEHGYSAVVAAILDHPHIEVRLGEAYARGHEAGYDHLFFTGPIDAFFGYESGRLGYRTVTFETLRAEGDFQGVAQMNYTDLAAPWTRICEHKHFAPWERHERTTAVREFSKETEENDTPFYPKRLARDLALLAHYHRLAEETAKVSFLGRLATYRYMDMERVIAEALEFAEQVSRWAQGRIDRIPSFPEGV